MKILEISGSNLASLKGPFCLALDRAPFTRNGLFAIRGATGSGKSTIIDAMCLALYDCIPRFGGGQMPRVGPAGLKVEERLVANDVRGILQRGTGEAWAQVRFQGADGRAWRARWSVARARKSPAGRYQVSEMELEDLASGTIHRLNKSEMLVLIRSKVGLSYDQFRRSVLLAQGEFAAFTKASKDDRASLLEAMTGAEIYARLSRAAFERCAAEQRRARELRTRLEALGTLDGEARAELDAACAEAAARIPGLETELRELTAGLAWHGRLEELQGKVREAEAGAEAARAAWAGAAERRDALLRVESAQFLLPAHTRVQAARDAKDALARQIGALEGELPGKQSEQDAREGELRILDQGLAQALEAISRAKPLLEAARSLDTRAESAGKALHEAEQVTARLLAERDEAERALAGSMALDEDLAARNGRAEAALEATLPFRQLAQAWDWIDQEIGAFGTNLQGLAAARAGQAAAQAGTTTRTGSLEALRIRREELALRHQERRRELEGLDRELAAEPLRSLNATRQALQAELDQCRQAETLLARLHEHLAQARKAGDEAAGHAAARSQGEAQAREAENALPALAGTLAGARRFLDQARAALSLEDRRALLVDGAPCPLCGGLDHPWAQGSPLAGLLHDQEALVLQLEAEQLRLEGERSAGRARADEAARAGAGAREAASLQASRVQLAEQAWAGLRAGLGGLPEDPGAAAGPVGERVLDLERRLLAVEELDASRLRLTRGKDVLLEDQRRDEEERGRLEGESAGLGRQLQELALEAARAAQAARNLETALDGQRERLEPVLGRTTLADLERDPGSLRARLGSRVAERREAEAARDDLAGRRAELALVLHAQRATTGAARKTAQESGARADEARRALGEIRQARLAYFSGGSAAQAEAGLEAERERAGAARERARAAAQKAREARDGLAGAIATLQGQLRLAQAQAEVAEAAWAAGLASWGGDPATLAPLLSWTQEAIQDERQALGALETGLKSAEAVLLSHRAQEEAHQGAGRPGQAREDLAARHGAARTGLDALRSDLGGLRRRVEQDDELRGAAAGIRQAMDQQQEVLTLWEGLSGLIGSASGAVFRSFAQSLTLETLVAFANEQLKLLKPRYRLERVPGFEMDLQIVDQDMGDEIRPVHSLSGGETFLVSLALALGLSSLSASTTSIESLFIDEGFGTLDAESLDVALSVLDVLQEQGRQVGIISHVDTLSCNIPVQVLVERLGAGRSRVLTPVYTSANRSGD